MQAALASQFPHITGAAVAGVVVGSASSGHLPQSDGHRSVTMRPTIAFEHIESVYIVVQTSNVSGSHSAGLIRVGVGAGVGTGVGARVGAGLGVGAAHPPQRIGHSPFTTALN